MNHASCRQTTWFPTWVRDALPENQARVVHAKRMGTLRAACGEDATFWVKAWDKSFESEQRKCQECERAVADSARDDGCASTKAPALGGSWPQEVERPRHPGRP